MNTDESPPIFTDTGVNLILYEELKENGAASAKKGQPIFNTALMVRIETPGDSKSSNIYEVDTAYPDEFPHPVYGKLRKNETIYKRFGKYIDEYKVRQGGPATISGTPIETWPQVTAQQVRMLKHHQIYSVEALAGLSDAHIAAIGIDGRKLVQKAKDWLTMAATSAEQMARAEKERQTETRFAALETQFKDLAEALAELPPEEQAKVKASLAKKGKKTA